MKNDEKKEKRKKYIGTISAELASQEIKPTQNLVEYFADLLMRDETPLQIQGKGDILRFIKEAQEAGDVNEALWRAFLATHFGRLSADVNRSGEVESAWRFLCAFGDKPTWTLMYIFTQANAFIKQLRAHEADLRTLHFANHRKFCSKQPHGIVDVIESFVLWVRRHGGSPAAAFAPEEGSTQQQGFGELYQRFDVYGFGRLGRFDLLHLLGKMGLEDIEPDSCYLVGSTGPLVGAKDLCGASAVRFSDKEMNGIMDDLAARLEVPYAVMEDALCLLHKGQSNCSNQSDSAGCL